MRLAVCLIVLVLGACRFGPPKFDQTTEEFVFTALSMSPVAATAAGYHRHAGVPLDELMDDMSEAAISRQRDFYRGFGRGLSKIDRDKLTPEDQADYDLIANQIRLTLLDLETTQRYKHDPTLYTDLIGQALFAPYTLEYGPKDLRFFHITRRMEQIPPLLMHARRNLLDSPEVHRTVARDGIAGVVGMIDKTLRGEVPPDLKPKFDAAADGALAALRDFDAFLERDLSIKVSDWRLGPEKYREKFRLALMTDRTPEQVLADAEAALGQIRRQMEELSHGDVRKALNEIAKEHATPETYLQSAQRDLDEARRFIQAKVILSLSPNDNLKVIATPTFMRGSFPVGGFNPAPALEPNLQAQYWLTPIPMDWPASRIESKLREYNASGLMLLTLHEAIPGHYAQFEYANAVEPRGRRLLRSLFGSGTYVEGWAMYSTQVMIEEGFLNHSRALRLTFLKQLLRSIANAILDVRMHTMGMTDEEALKLMTVDTFQELEEAEAKLQRVKLTSCQLPTYFVGWVDWLRLRERYRGFKGKGFLLPDFHSAVLREGALPVPSISMLLTKQALPEKLEEALGPGSAPSEN